jgi:hypothetical protein
MTGCNTLTTFLKGPAPKVSETLMVGCEKPQLLVTGDLGDLTDTLVVNTNKLHKCKDRHKTLVEQVRVLVEHYK